MNQNEKVDTLTSLYKAFYRVETALTDENYLQNHLSEPIKYPLPNILVDQLERLIKKNISNGIVDLSDIQDLSSNYPNTTELLERIKTPSKENQCDVDFNKNEIYTEQIFYFLLAANMGDHTKFMKMKYHIQNHVYMDVNEAVENFIYIIENEEPKEIENAFEITLTLDKIERK